MEDAMTDPLDEALAFIEHMLRDLGDVELAVPQAFFDELDELTAPRATANNQPMPFFGIRG
jgi:hypothetical protein